MAGGDDDASNRTAPGGAAARTLMVDLVTDGGFTITEIDVFYEKGAPKSLGADSLGVAVSP